MNKINWSLLTATGILWSSYFPLNIKRLPLYSSSLQLDNFIPFIPSFIIIYLSYFILVPGTFIFLLKKGSSSFIRTILMTTILTLTASYIIYLLFQTHIERPIINGDNLFSSWVVWLYSQDPPYSTFPSIHSALSTITIIIWSKIKWRFSPLMIIWATLIILSTILVKQHYFLDTLGGIILALVSFAISKNLARLNLSLR